MVENGEEVTNYHFVKSHENRYIQVSDMLVGLLGKLFLFLDENALQEIARYERQFLKYKQRISRKYTT